MRRWRGEDAGRDGADAGLLFSLGSAVLATYALAQELGGRRAGRRTLYLIFSHSAYISLCACARGVCSVPFAFSPTDFVNEYTLSLDLDPAPRSRASRRPAPSCALATATGAARGGRPGAETSCARGVSPAAVKEYAPRDARIAVHDHVTLCPLCLCVSRVIVAVYIIGSIEEACEEP